jgi:Tfp pilus assembly protein PilN
MIELNLLEKKKPLRLPVVLGVDLNELNFKIIVFAILFNYIPEIFVHNYYEDHIQAENDTLKQLSDQNARLNKELGKTADIKEQLNAYNEKVEKLKARSAQVEEILKIQTNPKKVLEKIARSIPDELWFTKLEIKDDKSVEIEGGAYNSRSIGEFITLMNDSPFFGSTITPTKQEAKSQEFDGVTTNFETFTLKGRIKNYDMNTR